VPLALSLCLGWARGGSLRNLLAADLRAPWIPLLALGLQLAIFEPTGPLPFLRGRELAVHVASYVVLGAFLWANRHLPGVWLVALGFACNAAAILANGGLMPASVEALRAAGVAGARLGLGHAAFLRALLDGAGLEEEDRRAAQAALYRKDFVTLSSLLEGVSPDIRRTLLDLPSLRGPDALPRARALGVAEAAVDDLSRVLEALAPYGVEEEVEVDLGVIRDFDYYTGVVLEAYAPGSGAPLLGGGRYDQLLERFGSARPAVGFAVDVERVLAACHRVPTPPRVLEVVYEPPAREQALRWVRRARAAGLQVAAGPASRGASRPGLCFRGDGVWWVDGTSERPLGPDALEALLGGRTP